MSPSFKTLFDTVTLDEARRVVSHQQGVVPFQEIAAVEVGYSPAGSYSSESYPVHLRTRDGSSIEIANDAFGAARRAAVSAAEALDAPIHDLSFGKLATSTAREWSVPLRERLAGRLVPAPGLESPGEDLLCSRADDGIRFDVKPGAIGRTLRRLGAELREGDIFDWIWTVVLATLFLIPCLLILPLAMALYLVSRLQGRVMPSLTVSPAEVRRSGGIVPATVIPAEAIQDVGLFWQKRWRGRWRLLHLVIRSDDARIEFPVAAETEAEWVRRHVLAALAAR